MSKQAEYASLEDVAAERGEEPAKVARQLVRRGCDLFLWFGPSRKRAGEIIYPEHPLRRDEYAISPGAYPLTQESREAVIKRLERGENETEGLEILIETDDTLGGALSWPVRLTEQDDSICVVVNPADLSQLPPPPACTSGGTAGTGDPTPRGEKNSDNFESGKRTPHTAFIAHEVRAGTKRATAWKKLKRLASESLGTTQVRLSDYGLIYLKRDRRDPENAVRYKHDKFEHRDDGELIKKGAFNTAWTKEKKANMKQT